MKAKSTLLEDNIADAFEKRGYIVFRRRHHCDVVAVKPDMSLAYIVECKNYEMSRKQQMLAVRELNRNYEHGRGLLAMNRLFPDIVLKVLVAHEFKYQAKNMYQYTPSEFLEHIMRGA